MEKCQITLKPVSRANSSTRASVPNEVREESTHWEYVSLAKRIAKIGLMAAVLATTGCGGGKTAEKPKAAPAKAPAASKPAPKKMEEPEPVVTETPTAMDEYVKQRRAARKARGPVDYPDPVPIEREVEEDSGDTEDVEMSEKSGGDDASMDKSMDSMDADSEVLDDGSLDSMDGDDLDDASLDDSSLDDSAFDDDSLDDG